MKTHSASAPHQPLPRAGGNGDFWHVAGSSQVGTAHLGGGRACEDAHGWFVSGGLLGIAVADGAGSARHAAIGSVLAVQTAVTSILDMQLTPDSVNLNTARDFLGFATQCVQNQVAAKAVELCIEPMDLACTFLLVIGHPDFVAAAHVGDGAVVVMNDEGDLVSLTTPTNGDFANQTPLLGCARTTDVSIRTLPGFRLNAVAAFTDGLQRLALQLPAGTPHAPFFLPLFARLGKLSAAEGGKFIGEFLGSDRVTARTDDDKTLVVATVI